MPQIELTEHSISDVMVPYYQTLLAQNIAKALVQEVCVGMVGKKVIIGVPDRLDYEAIIHRVISKMQP